MDDGETWKNERDAICLFLIHAFKKGKFGMPKMEYAILNNYGYWWKMGFNSDIYLYISILYIFKSNTCSRLIKNSVGKCWPSTKTKSNMDVSNCSLNEKKRRNERRNEVE